MAFDPVGRIGFFSETAEGGLQWLEQHVKGLAVGEWLWPWMCGDGGGKVVMCWGLIVKGLVFLVQECEYHIVGCQKSLDHCKYL